MRRFLTGLAVVLVAVVPLAGCRDDAEPPASNCGHSGPGPCFSPNDPQPTKSVGS